MHDWDVYLASIWVYNGIYIVVNAAMLGEF